MAVLTLAVEGYFVCFEFEALAADVVDRDLEGFILDRAYLSALQTKFATNTGAFCGYGVATPDLRNPPVDWCGASTYIQKEGINRDFGVFDSPDEFYQQRGVNLSGIKRWLFENVFRRSMNKTVGAIRSRA